MSQSNRELQNLTKNEQFIAKESIAKIDALTRSTEAIFKAYDSWTQLEIEKERTNQSFVELERIRTQGIMEVEQLKIKLGGKQKELEIVCKDREATRVLLRELLIGVQKNIENLLELQKILLQNKEITTPISDQINACCRNYSELISSIPSHLPL